MKLNEYQKLAARTARIEAPTRRLLNAALGICGEAGEVSEHIKKHFFHGRELNSAAFIAELGDVLWYLSEAATALGVELEEVAQGNIDKLSIRYPDGFKP